MKARHFEIGKQGSEVVVSVRFERVAGHAILKLEMPRLLAGEVWTEQELQDYVRAKLELAIQAAKMAALRAEQVHNPDVRIEE